MREEWGGRAAVNNSGEKSFNFAVYPRNFRKNTDLGW